MKCKCGYVDGWHDMEQVEGGLGPFYQLPVKLERGYMYEDEREEVYGCPKCGTVFIEV